MDPSIGKIVLRFIRSHKEDLMKQMIIIVGAPASGKSYFVNSSFKSIPAKSSLKMQFPRLLHLSIGSLSESDNSLRRLQYEAAGEDFAILWNLVNSMRKKNSSELEIKIKFNDLLRNDKSFRYTPEGESPIFLSSVLAYEDFVENRTTIGSYFSSKGDPINRYYLSMRGRGGEETSESLKESARKIFEDTSKAKLMKVGDAVIVDCAGEDINNTPFNKLFNLAKRENFSISLVELNIPLKLSLLRNELRGKKGRRVPPAQVEKAYQAMQNTVRRLKKNPQIDRFIRYKWKSLGEGPFDGNFYVDEEDRIALKRRLEKLKSEKKAI